MEVRTAAQRRTEIAEAVLRLLADTTQDALTTRQVARAVGISQPALFRHFRSRDQLVAAAVAHAQEALEGLAERLLAPPARGPAGVGPDAPLSRLERLGAGLLDLIARHPGLPRLLLSEEARGLPATAATAATATEGAALARLTSMQRALVVALLREAQAAGHIAPADELAVADAAALFQGLLYGLMQAWVAGGRAEPEGLRRRFGALYPRFLRAVAPLPGAPSPADAPIQAAPADAAIVHPAGPLKALDVRPILRRGVDPLETILAELSALPAGGVLAVLAPFRPAPLLALMARRGHAARCEAVPPDLLDGPAVAGGAPHLMLIVVGGAPEIDDLRDREAPEPLERVLACAGAPPADRATAVRLFRLPRFPALLLPHLVRLEAQGVRHAALALPDGTGLVRLSFAP